MNSHGNALVDMETMLRARFQIRHLELRDDSQAHAGHRVADGRGHYTVRIVANEFTGLPRLARHRLVNDAMAPLYEHSIHALRIEAFAPDEAPSFHVSQ